MKLWTYIKDEALKNPSQTIQEDNSEITFEETVIFAEQFAKKIRGEKCCAVLCVSETAAAIGILTCVAAGVTAIPLPYRYGEKYFNRIINAVNPTCMITDLTGKLDVIFLPDSGYVFPEEKPAFIMFSSGTTGKPKGIMLSEKNIISNIKGISLYFNIKNDDSILISRPLFHCAVMVGEFFISLVKGVKIHFYSDNFNPFTYAELIKEKNITIFCGTPTMMRAFSRLRKKTTSLPLKNIAISGEYMSDETATKLKKAFPYANIYYVYGLTEASPRVAYLPPENFGKSTLSVGRPLKSVKIKILKEDGSLAKTNETGVLWVKGGNVMLGYFNDKKKTEETIKDGWLKTGDVAYIDERGFLNIKGRSDDMIIRAGMNIYPQAIEEILKTDLKVKDVFVYGVPDKNEGMKIAMKISGNFADEKEVREMCLSRLPSFEVPTIIEIVDEINKTGFGKIIRGDKNV